MTRRAAGAAAALALWLAAAVAAAASLQVRYDSEHFGVIFPSAKTSIVLPFANRLETLRDRAAERLGFEIAERVVIRLAPDRATFESLAGGSTPKGAIVLARPEEKTIVMSAPDAMLRRGPRGGDAAAFINELSRVELYCRLGERRAPRWLDEGLAQLAAGRRSSWDAARLTLALLFDSLVPLRDLFGDWPGGGRARLARAESLSVVEFLKRRDWLAPLLDKLAAGYSPLDALAASSGVGLGRFEQMWKRDLNRRQLWLAGLNQSAWWFLLAVLLVFGGIVARLRRRRKYERLDDDLGPNQRIG